MKTKSLLEIIFKSIGFLLVIPNVIYMPVTMYTSIFSFYSFDSNAAKIPYIFIAILLLYLVMLYYLLVRTDILVSWVYKEKEDEANIKLNFYSKDVIFIAIVLASAYSIFSVGPAFFVDFFRAIDLSDYESSFLDRLFVISNNYVYYNAAQLVTAVIILLNAQRITGWIELYRKKQKAPKNSDSE